MEKVAVCSTCSREVEFYETWEVLDARGIYCGRVCSNRCEKELESRYRPEVFSNPGYEADEPIEEDLW